MLNNCKITIYCNITIYLNLIFNIIYCQRGGGANTKVPDMYGVGVFSGPKTQK